MRHTTLHVIHVLTALWLLAACSSDEEQPEQLPTADIQVTGVTRAPLGDEASLGDIQAFLVREGRVVVDGLFSMDGGVWNSTYKLSSEKLTYQLFGYMPATGVVSSALSLDNVLRPVLTLNGLKPITDTDVTVIAGVKKVVNRYDVSTPTPCAYDFEYAGVSLTSGERNYLNLLFEHVYSRLKLKVVVAGHYAELRDIKLKRMTLHAERVGKVNAEVTMRTGSYDIYYPGIERVAYQAVDGTTTSCVLWDDERGVLLPADVGGVNIALGSTMQERLVLESTYEVYDKKGQLLSTRTSSNKLSAALADLRWGQEKELTLTVKPSYLYQLSDGDLDNPEVTLE